MKEQKQNKISVFSIYFILQLTLLLSCAEKNDNSFSQRLFYPNPNLKTKDLKALDLKDPEIHSVNALYQQLGDTSIYYFFDSSDEKIKSIAWEIAFEDNNKNGFREILDQVNILCEEGLTYESAYSEQFWVQNLNNNLFFLCRILQEDGKLKLYVEYFYPKLN